MQERFEWYYMGDTGQLGPLSEPQLLDLADHGVLTADTLVWKVGMPDWAPANRMPIIASRLRPHHAVPAVASPPPAPSPPGYGMKVTCPRDGTPLRHDLRSGVEIDWCPNCRGVWLDRGELEKIVSRSGNDRYDDDDDDDGDNGRRRGFLGNVFDIFD